jgi:hypothetical protein
MNSFVNRVERKLLPFLELSVVRPLVLYVALVMDCQPRFRNCDVGLSSKNPPGIDDRTPTTPRAMGGVEKVTSGAMRRTNDISVVIASQRDSAAPLRASILL